MSQDNISTQLPDEVCSQLKIMDQSKFYSILIIAGIIISLHNIDLQKKELICTALGETDCKCEEVYPLRIISSIIIITALVFFYDISSQAVENTDGTDCSANINLSAASLTLLAGFARFAQIFIDKKKSTLETQIENNTDVVTVS